MKYILQCEDSIEGIFSAVYSAWELKYGHENTSIQVLGGEEETLELFTTYIPLKPDVEKAQKVLNTIQRVCSEAVYERLFYAACSDAADKADTIYRYIQTALRMGSRVVNHLADPAVARVMELSRAVGNAQHHYLGFLRFIEIPEHILLARYEPKHRLTELIMPHFVERFPEERFVIWDTVRNVAGVHVPGESFVMLHLTEAQTAVLRDYTEDNMEAEQLWRAFVESISIKERENKKLQRNNIPLHFRTYMPEFKKGEERP
ncbi:MAG: TIGR03915 family putative DNA repair protein [Lachnospiraceae bacterium]|nr:TIGR03915 family putative DNA repair protein [Lachnospiraceae bacterium]